jgi:hypothetical protein
MSRPNAKVCHSRSPRRPGWRKHRRGTHQRHRGRIEQAVPPLHVLLQVPCRLSKSRKNKSLLKHSLALKRRRRKAPRFFCREFACKHLILARTGADDRRDHVRKFVLTNERTTRMKSPRSRCCLMIKGVFGYLTL